LKSCNAATRSIEATEVAPDKEEKKKKGKKKFLHIYNCLQKKKQTCLTSLKNDHMQKYEWLKIISKYIPLRLRLLVFVIEKKHSFLS
jgi:hypothetical protein